MKTPPLPLWKAAAREEKLRLARRHVSDEIDHILVGKLRDHALHQRDRRTFAGARLDVVELAQEIIGPAPGQPRHVAEALEFGTVADRALDGLAVAAGRGQGFALLDAAGPHIIDKAGVLIAQLSAFAVFRNLVDHRLSDIDGLAYLILEAHAAGADMVLRRFAFDDLDPFLLRRLDAGEIVGGFLQFGLADVLCHFDHYGRTIVHAVSVAEF